MCMPPDHSVVITDSISLIHLSIVPDVFSYRYQVREGVTISKLVLLVLATLVPLQRIIVPLCSVLSL